MAACTVNNVSLVSRDTCGRFCAKPVDTNSKTARLRGNTSRTRSCPRKPLLISGIDGWLENSVRTGQFAVKRRSARIWLEDGWRVNLAGYRLSDATSSSAGRDGACPVSETRQAASLREIGCPFRFRGDRYPLTLILENDSTAVPAVGRPMESAGWNVVKISRFFNCGSTAFASSGCDRMR